MNYTPSRTALALALASAFFTTSFLVAEAKENPGKKKDFGVTVEQLLNAQSETLFGFNQPLIQSAPETTGAYRSPAQQAIDQVLVADGLNATYLTRNAADKTDMMALYPLENPTHLITCVEGERQDLGGGKFNPSIQSIHLTSGEVKTILRGLNTCDGIRTTPWNTILATEEDDQGGAYEILDPLNVANQTVLDRGAGITTDPAHIAKRTALPTMAWEGLAILPSGVVIAGDELRPGTPTGTGNDADGGAIFKFVPQTVRIGNQSINDLASSPLTAGTVYALQVSCVNNKQQFGQGCEIGNADWIPIIDPGQARAEADANGATGYYRPEDLHQDLSYADPINPESVRFCWANTGNEGAFNFGEVICGVDDNPAENEAKPARQIDVNRFVEGDADFNSFDNLEFQPNTGNLYVIEDHENGDIFACLPDGKDRDIKTDGCVKMLSVKDSSAEPTGFIFTADGTTAYVSIQHSNDGNMTKVDDYHTDDIIRITGFKIKK